MKLPVLPSPHYLLLGFSLAMLLTFAVVHVGLIRPRKKEAQRLEERIRQTRERINRQGWPLEHNYLQELVREKKAEKKQLEKKQKEVFNYAASVFEDRVSNAYENWDLFKNQVSRLDYQQEFQRIKSKLEENGIKLNEDILNLSEESTHPRTYELVLKLWALEAVVDKILAYDLTPLSTTAVPVLSDSGRRHDRDESEKDRTSGAAITVLPAVSFYRDDEEKNLYLREFRVRVRVKSKLSSFYNFLRESGTSDDFIAIPQMELYKTPPAEKKGNDDEVIVDMVCAAFYLADRQSIGRGDDEDEDLTILPLGA
ncbi:MAG: hypothetical protein ACOCZS_02845 [Verrucomicrobiota bacterium]